MASKFRNLIASKLRHGMTASAPKPSLRELESKMRLEASPNHHHPFRICLPKDRNLMSSELIEGIY